MPSRRPTFGDLCFAVRTLTILPVPSGSGSLGPATLFFPAVGLLIGAAACAVDIAAADLPEGARAFLVAAVLAGAGAGRSVAGFARTAASLHLRQERALALESMQKPGVPPSGALAAAVLLACKLSLLWTPGPLRLFALLFSPMLGRWAMVVVAYSSRRASAGAPGTRFEPGITFTEFGWTSVLAVGLALVFLEAAGLVAFLSVAALAIGIRLALHRWIGGVNVPTLWASAEIAEVAAFAAFAAAGIR